MVESLQFDPNKITTGSYVLKKDQIFDDNGNLLFCLHTSKGRHNIRTAIGNLQFSTDQPDRIELFKTLREKIGLLVLKEKGKFTLEVINNIYTIEDPWTDFLSVLNKEGNSVLHIEKMKGDRESHYQSIYKLYLKGNLSLVLSILIVLFFVYYQHYSGLMHPPEYSYSYSCRLTDSWYLNFYDLEGNLFAKTSRANSFWMIIGAILLFYGLFLIVTERYYGFLILIIGIIIIAIPTMQTHRKSSIILEETGKKIATIKTNAMFSKVSFTIPAIDWSGKIVFHNDSELPYARITTTDGDYLLKQMTIIEDLNGKQMMAIYTANFNNFRVVEDSDIKFYKSLVLTTIIIRKYFIPDD